MLNEVEYVIADLVYVLYNILSKLLNIYIQGLLNKLHRKTIFEIKNQGFPAQMKSLHHYQIKPCQN